MANTPAREEEWLRFHRESMCWWTSIILTKKWMAEAQL